MPAGRPLSIPAELLEAFEHSGRVSEYLVSVIPDEVWRVEPPSGRGRSIAAIVAHMQSVRRTFERMSSARVTGASLDRRRVTRTEAQAAIRASTVGLTRAFSPRRLPRGAPGSRVSHAARSTYSHI